ncbi:hypothetical protein PMZ80_004822 [Knufia obscura]|uniref:Phosphotransferase n=1 Tax=Knufia obscura TaxID=1635080 RepID=A0ABR0RPU6_9EURO|nr:hypothetical protein PMZ80_004822 [Knufia obscura]
MAATNKIDGLVDGTNEKQKGPDLPTELRDELEKLEQQFYVDRKKLKQISERFQQELEEGLQDHGKNIAMYVTWVLGFPTGKEKGDFLTLDLGGTNLRVCWINLRGNEHEIGIKQQSYKMPDSIKTGDASSLWSFIASSLQTFISDHSLNGAFSNPLNLGFTFSYPAIQDYIDQGILQTWTKGFDIKGVEGEDVASQLRSAISDLNLPVSLVAVVNDTTGAMIASSYHDPKTIIGAIFGTGCNAAYMDKISNIPKINSSDEIKKLDPETPMAINCEYGAFDNARNVLPLTKYDEQIDATSPRPGEQAFEKTSAGLYLGEIFRLIILDLHSRNIIFKDQDISKLQSPYTIDTSLLSNIEDDDTPDLSDSGNEFKATFNITMTQPELQFTRALAKLIAVRGARLCATGIAAICRHQKISSGHVAADGSVANKHPKFKKRWGRALGEILDWSEADREENDESGEGDESQKGPIVLTSAEDGSGVGAAVIAAMTLERWGKGQKAGIKGSGRE